MFSMEEYFMTIRWMAFLLVLCLFAFVLPIRRNVARGNTTKTPNTSNTAIRYDSLGIPMIPVPEGTFIPGYAIEDSLKLCNDLKAKNASYICDPNEPLGLDTRDDRYTLGAERTVTHVKSFYIDQYEVSRADYKKCVNADVCEAHMLDVQ